MYRQRHGTSVSLLSSNLLINTGLSVCLLATYPPVEKELTFFFQYSLYFDGSGSFDWNVDPYYYCETSDGGAFSCLWHDNLNNLGPGIPFAIPKVTVSLIKVIPPHVPVPRVKGRRVISN